MKGILKLLVPALIALIIVAGAEAVLLADVGTQTQQEPVRVACIGDSITRGTEYTLDLWALIGSNYIVGDFGVGGSTVSLNSGAAYLNKTAFETADEFQPDIVLIMLGTNDAAPIVNETINEFVNDYITLIDVVQRWSSKPDVYLLMPPPIDNASVNHSSKLLADRVQPGIYEVVDQTGLPLIDAYTPLVGQPELFLDGVHPTAEGAQLIAKAVYDAVEWPIKPAQA